MEGNPWFCLSIIKDAFVLFTNEVVIDPQYIPALDLQTRSDSNSYISHAAN